MKIVKDIDTGLTRGSKGEKGTTAACVCLVTTLLCWSPSARFGRGMPKTGLKDLRVLSLSCSPQHPTFKKTIFLPACLSFTSRSSHGQEKN